MAGHARMFRECDRRVAGVKQAVGIRAVHDIHMMALIGQRMREAVDLHPIAAERVRRIKRREMKKAETAVHAGATLAITSIICRAAFAQVSLEAASRPRALIRVAASSEERMCSSARLISAAQESTKIPAPSSRRGSGLDLVAITGQPQAAASTAGSPKPSISDGSTRT